MSQASAETPKWETQPAAAMLIRDFLAQLRERLLAATDLEQQLLEETGTRLIDWIDHMVVPNQDSTREQLQGAGFVEFVDEGEASWRHPGAMFPVVRTLGDQWNLALKVENVDDYLSVNGLSGTDRVLGDPGASLRIAVVAAGDRAELKIVERHGDRTFEPRAISSAKAAAATHHRQQFDERRRAWENPVDGFQHASDLISQAIADLGQARTCDLFFAAERANWQRRNRAGRVQKQRQDALGFGWANHDHHTFRSSREYFANLVTIFEQLGFACRERFYAGEEAGWGAQVLEHEETGILVFTDVDMSPDEVQGDFSHEGLTPSDDVGTVGLWCKLHGEAFLEAGMHHLECQFDFDEARKQLAIAGILTMPPFTDFPFLRQAFTVGEMWQISPEKLEAALACGAISAKDAKKFGKQGALGSHLEILERNDGFKGFNQTGISDIIKKTDPRGGKRRA